MATLSAVDRPPAAHPVLNAGDPHARPHSGVPHSGQQDPGPYNPSQYPGASSSHPQHHAPARPMFYVPAPSPPPPPFLHYQWPMPFSYNPFAGFPGMGYGMVMPPFPPPPFMEHPAYILPHPHMQPVDYRRFVHPQVPAYHHPNQAHRIRPAHTVPVRETVNCEVQTEPTQRGVGGYAEGSPLVGADSGQGTAANSPSSSSSGSQKQGSAEVGHYTSPDANAISKHDFIILHPTREKAIQSCTEGTQSSDKHGVGQENVPPCRNVHCHVWSVDSPDGMVPVCSSSQQEDEVVKERRVSVPDILMSWGGGTPQAMRLKMADAGLPHNDHNLPSYDTEVENEKSVFQSPENGQVVADGEYANDDSEGNFSSKNTETLFKILKLPYAVQEYLSESRIEASVGSPRHSPPTRDELLLSLNDSQKLPENETNPHDTTEIIPYEIYLSHSQMKRRMNESVWSVEGLSPFFPTKDWLQQNGVFDPEVIVEMTEEADNVTPTNQNIRPIEGLSRSRRISPSDYVSMSDSWLIYSTPAEKPTPAKKPETEIEMDASERREPRPGQSMAPSQKDPLTSPPCHMPSKLILSTATEEDMAGSTEPEPFEGSNQESLIIDEQSTHTPEQEKTLLLNRSSEKTSPTGHLIVKNGMDIEVEDGPCGNGMDIEVEDVPCGNGQVNGNQNLCVPSADQKIAEVSPSKAHLVDRLQTKTHTPEQEKTLLLNRSSEETSPIGHLIVKNGMDIEVEDGPCGNGQVNGNQNLCVPSADQKIAEVSPSKAHLVDCGVQCTESQGVKCPSCNEPNGSMGPVNRRRLFKYSGDLLIDVKKSNDGTADGFCLNGHMQGPQNKRPGYWKKRGQGKQNSGQEFNGYYGKPGKSRGGNGRNPWYEHQ